MPEPLKNMYSARFISGLIESIQKSCPEIDAELVEAHIYQTDWDELALKERSTRLAHALSKVLPHDFPTALNHLKCIQEEAAKRQLSKQGFEFIFFPEFVATYGLEHPELSLDALAVLTPYSSSELAIRHFILEDSIHVMSVMETWAKDDNYHVRRLASEGCRPRLPWAMALTAFKNDPSPVLPILEQLKNDESEYVRRSVGNNLNDISKDHPDMVLSIAKQWIGHSPETDKLVKHGLRTLLKKGDKTALGLFQLKPSTATVENLHLTNTGLSIGDTATFTFELNNADNELQTIRLEYAVSYRKANGSQTQKVFKISERTYPAGVTAIKRNQRFADMSTRKHHPGEHGITILINGEAKASLNFTLS